MKTIGILGGMSFESTQHYYGRINRGINARLGGLSCAKMVLINVDFAEIRQCMVVGDWDAIGARLAEMARGLEQAGADCVVIASNTIHKVAPAVQEAVGIPLLHIADCAAHSCKERGIGHAGLLGTKYTMEEPFLVQRLERNGLRVSVPNGRDRMEVDRVIFDELCKGRVRADSRREYMDIIQAMITRSHIDGLILGCTEIEMLMKPEDITVPVVDTLASHIDMIVDFALS